MRVQPKPGVLVRHPVTKQPLPPGGAEVEDSSFWLRRLRDGDVGAVPPPQQQHNEPSSNEVKP
jgi:hypothetical protein